MPQIRFPNGANVNLMAVRNAIQEQCEENGIPVSFADAQLKVGGLFSKELKISSSCAILSTSLTIFILQSASSTRANMLLCRYTIWAEARTLSMIIEPTLKHGVALEDLCSMLSGGHRAKLEAEQNYYTILHDCLENVSWLIPGNEAGQREECAGHVIK